MRSYRISVCLLALLPAISFGAATPTAIEFQGILTDGGGVPVPDGNYGVTFTIYDASSGGNVKWVENQSIATEDGQFTATLGSITPLDDTVFSDTNRYLGIQVGNDPELTPRTKLVTVPYSFRTATVDGASGGVLSGSVTIQGSAKLSETDLLRVEGTVHATSGGFRFPDGSLQATAASSAPIPRTAWLSPYWADASGANIYTFVSVYNASTSSNRVTLTWYDEASTQVAQCLQTINPNELWIVYTESSGLASSCASSTQDEDGYLTVDADSPVAVWGSIFSPTGWAMTLDFFVP